MNTQVIEIFAKHFLLLLILLFFYWIAPLNLTHDAIIAPYNVRVHILYASLL